MNVRSSQAGSAAAQRVASLMSNVERLLAERRDAEAERLFREAEAISPDHPLVLHEQARRLMLGGQAAAAREILDRLVALLPNHLPFWLSLAAVLRATGRREEELQVLDRALALDPTHLVVLLQKGALLELLQKPRSAAAVYSHALHTLAAGTPLSPAIDAHVRHAQTRVAEDAAVLAESIDARLGSLRPAVQAAGSQVRFQRCLDRVLGRRRVYTPDPTFLLFPYLANYEFYERETFPWLTQLEAATDSIREELLGVLNDDREGVEPYIAFTDNLPLRQFRELNHSPRWGAYFLWNQGAAQELHLARCPRTAATLGALPQVDIPGRGPTAFFSILDAHTHIPPHTGVTNTRLTVHLPLMVPANCRFRVGGETREWREGTAWVFDDTIEHEAWNDSDTPRAILIFDVWHPQLSNLERDQLRETIAALAEYYQSEGSVSGVVI